MTADEANTENSLQISPEQYDDNARALDIAFIEKVLGLKHEGDSVKLVRRNAHALNSLAYLETQTKGD